MNNFVKRYWLWGLLALGPFHPAIATADNSTPSLTTEVFDSGTIVVKDHLQEVVHINPVIFTGNFVEKHWEGTFEFQAGRSSELEPGFNAITRVHGVPVDLQYSVEPSGTGLHIHYHLVPRESVEVSCIDVYASFPYSDWQGDSYEFNDNEGLIPVDRVTDWAIRQADSAPLSMGPSHNHGGLTVQMTSEGLHLVMADNRFYSPQLSMVYSHNDSKPNWIWEKGEKKDFDFTITFNRPIGAPSDGAPALGPSPMWKGCPSTLIDDFQDPSRNGKSPDRANFWGGHWRTNISSGSIGVTYGGPGQSAGQSSAGVTGTSSGFAIFQCPLYEWRTPFNATCHGLTGVQFYMKGDGRTYRVEVPNMAVTDNWTWYGANIHTSPGQWTFYQIPFVQMTRKSLGGQPDLPQNPDGTDVTGIQFFPMESGDFSYSLAQVSFYGSCVPDCSTPGAKEASTPTITPTPLSDDCLDRVIDDFDDPSRIGSPPTRVNRWGGKWNTVASSDSHMSVSYGDPGADGTRLSATVSGENPLDSKGGDAVFQTLLFANGTPFNTVIHGLTGVQFWMKGDGNSYWFNVLSSAVTDINGYSFNVVPPKGVWTFFRVPFKEMSLKSWWETEGGEATHPDGSNITGIGFESKGRGSFAFNVDQIAFYGNPSNCPNPKVPEEPTLVPTPLPTLRSTWTFTATPSNTPWPTFTPIPIPTATPLPRVVPISDLRPSPTPYSFPAIVPLPTSTPRPQPKRTRIRPTPTWVWRPPRPATPWPWPARTPILKAVLPTPTIVAPSLLSLLDKEQAIDFTTPPANIYVTFGDGPGWYQLQIVDRGANLVKTIYDKHVVAETDAWVEWDGRDEKGHDMPPGQYFVVIYKDGTALKSISVVRSPVVP